MIEFLQIVIFAFVAILMLWPITIPLVLVALLLAWSGSKSQRFDVVQGGRWRKWCMVQGLPSLMIAVAGAVAAWHQPDHFDPAELLPVFGFLLLQFLMTAVACWRFRARWKSTLSVAIGWGIYSIGVAVTVIASSGIHV